MEVLLADVLSFLLFLFGSYICGWWWFNGVWVHVGREMVWDGMGWNTVLLRRSHIPIPFAAILCYEPTASQGGHERRIEAHLPFVILSSCLKISDLILKPEFQNFIQQHLNSHVLLYVRPTTEPELYLPVQFVEC